MDGNHIVPPNGGDLLTDALVRRLAAAALAEARPSERTAIFCRHLLNESLEPARRHLQAMRRAGAPVEWLVSSFLPDAARRLGTEWTADRLSFIDVTLASSNLQRLLHEILPPTPDHLQPRGRVRLTLAPDETHSLGAVVAAHQLRQRGFIVTLDFDPDVERALRSTDHDVIAVSIASEKSLSPLERMLPRASKPVLLGGALAGLDADLPRRVDGLAHVVTIDTALTHLKQDPET